MQFAPVCKGCIALGAKNPVPLSGPASYVMRLLGVRRSRMNPNICTYCEAHFQPGTNKQYQTVTATVLFADIRGYTTLSLQINSDLMAGVLSQIYDQVAQVVWAHDGVVNKFIGDAVLAIFDFPILREDAEVQAVAAAFGIVQAVRDLAPKILPQLDATALAVGIGIHTGELTVGKIGEVGADVTAIGPTVNLASRLQGAAGPGEVLVSASTYQAISVSFPAAEERRCSLKGIPEPVQAYALKVN
jgi:adenylate cyclase